jgi:transposase
MHIMYERCAGLDVHNKTVVACVLTLDGQGGWSQEIRTFGTMTVELLDTIPGVARRTAAMMVAEIGTAMTRFPSADHPASWAGVAPGNHASAGKRTSGKARKGNRFLRTTLVQAAHAAARTKGTYLSAPYRRLAARRGNKRAILAVAHAMLVMAYDMMQRKEPYRDAGADFFDRLQPEDTARRLVKRLESLGYHVTLQSASTDATP